MIGKFGALAIAALVFGGLPAQAETRVTYKSAKSTSSYYQMGVQLAEAIKSGTDGEMITTQPLFKYELKESSSGKEAEGRFTYSGITLSAMPRARAW